jgi:hypothetical protein
MLTQYSSFNVLKSFFKNLRIYRVIVDACELYFEKFEMLCYGVSRMSQIICKFSIDFFTNWTRASLLCKCDRLPIVTSPMEVMET